ncbi:hypothetical protein A1351_01955 [Methylosinus sp. R-45379]|jgi:hypothetical protein|uniref:hypothetical protein n=1 Tax=unclassified Methylosinus TaxID=2624500 RepID=UPI0004675448|nr:MULTISPECIES: hypothetical protein [unclassified Methylosinus]OAI26218.1 hypothetical protein A1351_01955 [Methylosinus sp. R-45379]TDX60049.1 hypothetical protein EDE12_12424 [Methylosinus sp. sav-2]
MPALEEEGVKLTNEQKRERNLFLSDVVDHLSRLRLGCSVEAAERKLFGAEATGPMGGAGIFAPSF